MVKKPSRSAHALSHTYDNMAFPVPLHTLNQADVFLRHGIPCMVLGQPKKPQAFCAEDDEHTVFIANLLSGNAWFASGNDQVFPVYNAKLWFSVAYAVGIE